MSLVGRIHLPSGDSDMSPDLVLTVPDPAFECWTKNPRDDSIQLTNGTNFLSKADKLYMFLVKNLFFVTIF